MRVFTSTVFFFALLFSQSLFAQLNKSLIQSFLEEKQEDLGLEAADIQSWRVQDEYETKKLDLTHVHIQQTQNGIPIYNAVANLAIKAGKIVSFGNRLEANLSARVNTSQPALNPLQAIAKAAEQLELPYTTAARALEPVNHQHFIFSAPNLSLEPIPVKLSYFPAKTGEIRLVWDLEIYQLDAAHWWSIRLDAQTGEILDQVDWVISCNFGSCGHNHQDQQTFWPKLPAPAAPEMAPPPAADQYRVFQLPLESPSHGPRSLHIGPFDALASPFGWHDDNGAAGAEYTITRGNNVYAYEDRDANNLPGYSPDGGASLNFDFPLNQQQPAAGYEDAAITNTFYMSNIIHDVLYQYGFDEAGGNFQENNYGRAGAAGDGVNAEAQDGSGKNNANFATPTDGTNPRMQMYLWDNNGSPYLTVNSPTAISGIYQSPQSNYGGAALPATPLTADLALVNDGTAPDLSDACEPIVNTVDVSGKIAVLYRGTCAFTVKVQEAQNAGAVAAIVINNQPGAPIVMGGGPAPGITIPAVMISDVDGARIVNEMSSGTVNATLQDQGVFDIDGDFDNGIIIHEYGHGISTRLTGGPNNSNCLSNSEQMGEGWSDWYALMMTIEAGDLGPDARGIGTFAIGEGTNGNGIRPTPYSTDMGVNPSTYATSNTSVVPHGVGYVWCTMLWDLSWAFIDRYGYDPDLYNGTAGNNMAMELVTLGLKLQACNPGFVDGRDAILQADQQLYGGANQCLIWEVFANRGLGFSADQGNTGSATDQTEAFDLPTACQNVQAEIYFSQEENLVIEETNCNFQEYTVDLNISLPPSDPATVTFVPSGSATASTDFTISPASVTFPAGVYSTQTVTIRVFNDGVVEGDEQLTIDLSLSTVGDAVITTNDNRQHILTIVDEDFTPTPSRTVVLLDTDFESGAAGYSVASNEAASYYLGSAADFPIGDWTVTNTNASTFAFTVDQDAFEGDRSQDYLITPSFSLIGMNSCQLTFDHAFSDVSRTGLGAFNESAQVLISLDGGNNFTPLANITNTSTNTGGRRYTTDWVTGQNVNLDAYVGQPDVMIAFAYNDGGSTSSDAYGFCVDNIYIEATATTNIQQDVNSPAPRTSPLGNNQTVHFYDPTSNNIMGTLENAIAWDYGCTQMEVDRDASAAAAATVNFLDADPANALMAKTFYVDPASNNAAGSYNATFYFLESEIAAWEAATGKNRSLLKVVKVANAPINDVNSSNYNSYDIEIVPATLGSFGANGVTLSASFSTGFSGFGFGDPNPTLLAVELLEFSAQAENAERIRINWSTAEEVEADYFMVQKSTDGIQFEDLARQEATGSYSDYKVYDEHPNMGYNYYRLKQVDRDGSSETSVIRVVNMEAPDLEVNLSPNPADNQLYVDLQANLDQEVRLEIYDAIGQKVGETLNKNLLKGQNRLSIPISDLPAAIYMLQIRNAAGELNSYRFVKD